MALTKDMSSLQSNITFSSAVTLNAEYGDAFVQKLADFFATNYPDLKGFNRRGLYRMKQFYELYKDNEKVSPLVTQLSWTNHLKIMSACKSMDERIFYMNRGCGQNLGLPWAPKGAEKICFHKKKSIRP